MKAALPESARVAARAANRPRHSRSRGAATAPASTNSIQPTARTTSGLVSAGQIISRDSSSNGSVNLVQAAARKNIASQPCSVARTSPLRRPNPAGRDGA